MFISSMGLCKFSVHIFELFLFVGCLFLIDLLEYLQTTVLALWAFMPPCLSLFLGLFVNGLEFIFVHQI